MYLDWVEAYDFGPVARAHPGAKEAMVEFVLDLARQARGLKPGFLVVPQNATELVSHPDYLAGIDGLAVENVFYRGDPTNGRNDLPVDPSFRAERLPYMQRVVEAGKPVYTVDYATQPAHVAEAYQKNRAWASSLTSRLSCWIACPPTRRRAIEAGEYAIVAQPVYNVGTGTKRRSQAPMLRTRSGRFGVRTGCPENHGPFESMMDSRLLWYNPGQAVVSVAV